jgi:hypothetical protein
MTRKFYRLYNRVCLFLEIVWTPLDRGSSIPREFRCMETISIKTAWTVAKTIWR